MDMLEIIKNNNSDNKYIKKVFNCSKKYNENLDKHNLNKVKLSQREIQVLVLIAEGLKREDVAHCLTMSQGTVRTHLQHIYQKLGVSGKVAAIKIAKSRKII
jgi:ATP/maltotriose-dependent transcriptional regulator MalT